MTCRLCRSLKFALVFLCAYATKTWAFVPPWVRLNLESGVTTNVFADSASGNDYYNSLYFDLDESVTSWLFLYYSGTLAVYSENKDLRNMGHQGGIELSFPVFEVGGVWLNGEAGSLRYGEAYSLYNRNSLSGSGGALYNPGDTWHFRSSGSLFREEYPSYEESDYPVNFSGRSFSIGANHSFPIPVVLDVEWGWQDRTYPDLIREAHTEYTYLNAWVSASLGRQTGARLRMQIRNQADPGNVSLASLFLGGLDPGSLLWDGMKTDFRVTQFLGSWRAEATAGLFRYDYLNMTLLSENLSSFFDDRIDSGQDVRLSLYRKFSVRTYPLDISVTTEYRFVHNNSNVDYFQYNSHEFLIRLGFEPFFW